MSVRWKIVSRLPPGIYAGGQQLFGELWGLIAFRVAHVCCRVTTRAHAHAHAHDYSGETYLFMSWNVLC